MATIFYLQYSQSNNWNPDSIDAENFEATVTVSSSRSTDDLMSPVQLEESIRKSPWLEIGRIEGLEISLRISQFVLTNNMYSLSKFPMNQVI